MNLSQHILARLTIAIFAFCSIDVGAQVHGNPATQSQSPLPVNKGGTNATTSQAAAQSLKTPFILYKGGVPLISLSSGSVSAVGAITGITALPTTYPNAYCYFPASILATSGPGSTAGYYYCTFSGTTTGLAFLNALPATGVATIPASTTAVTAGQGAFTGDTGEEFGPTVTVAANAMGANGALQIVAEWLVNNNANAKTGRVRFSGNAGTTFFSIALASAGQGAIVGQIANAATNVQTGSALFGSITGGSVTAGVGGTVDTTASTTLVFSLQKATATDNIVQYPPQVLLFSDGT